MFMLGPKASGKSTIARNMASRTNMRHINFDSFVAENNLVDADDETVTMELIQALAKEQMPRVIIESFPRNVFQAKFFLRNCKVPSHVYALECSIDISQ